MNNTALLERTDLTDSDANLYEIACTGRAKECKPFRKKVDLPLIGTLRACGIKPFVNARVVEYQNKKLVRWFWRSGNPPQDGLIALVCLLSMGVGFVVNVAVGIAIGVYACQLLSLPREFGFLSIAIPIIAVVTYIRFVESIERRPMMDKVFAIAMIGVGHLLIRHFGTVYEWQRVPLCLYENQVPAFVTETINKIKTRCPSANMTIVELVGKLDPFLLVSLETEDSFEEYYVEVWKEPRFDAKRLA